MAASERPAFRSAAMRLLAAVGSDIGRPRRTPLARFAANASRVRCPMSLGSNCAKGGDAYSVALPRADDGAGLRRWHDASFCSR
jgi:hypothetical protein